MKHTKRLLSLLMALILMLSILPALPLTTASAAQSITVYFKDADGWGAVYGYVWDANGNKLLGDWPGKQLTKGSNGLYALTVDFTPSSSNQFNFIFNNNAGSQTDDLTLSYAQLTSGDTYWVNGGSGTPAKLAPPTVDGSKVTFTYEGSGTNVYLAGSMNGWSTSANKLTKSGSVSTTTLTLAPGQYEYKLVVDGNWINDPGNPQTTGADNNNYIIMPGMQDITVSATKGTATSLPAEMTCVAADGTSQKKAVTYKVANSADSSYVTLSGNQLTVSTSYPSDTLALTASTSDGHSCTVTVDLSGNAPAGTRVKLHFINSTAWDGVCAYVWSSASALSQSWPGQTLQRDGDGYFTLDLTATFASGETMGVLFHNNKGDQTADITISASQLSSGSVELWVQPATAANSDGKFDTTVTDSLSKQFLSTQVDGNKVTFRYKGSGSKVYLAGSFNDWSTSATQMTKSGSVFSATVTLDPGIHEYKFVVDGNWITDPANALTGGYDGNSILVVPTGEAPEDTGNITVKLHFYRDSGYSGWDVWYWTADSDGKAATLQSVSGDKGRVATFTVSGKNTNVGYVIRKTDWSDKEFYDRFIDLSDVKSGTVHFYLNSGSATGSRILGSDVFSGSKITYANLDYDTGKIFAQLSLPYDGPVSSAFTITGGSSAVSVTGVSVADGGYWLTLSRKLTLSEAKNCQVVFNGGRCGVSTDGLFYSDQFAADYTYDGDDLGASWSKSSTTFKVWAPTAKDAHVKIYTSGNYGTDDQLQYVQMTQGSKGVWSVTVSGDLSGKYYNFDIGFSDYTVEATDPYATAIGANGDRGMILDLSTTDPDGWNSDTSPNQGMSYTDAIIYELHVREYTIDSSSGVKDDWKGTYLGLTQSGTTSNGYATGLDHLKELGITHVQLMPVFDFNSSDEYKLDEWEQYAWGYDPKNYNCVDGSYSTDPFNGAKRITEFKTMVQTFHENGINVVMDVVYNHTFDGGNYCGNKIVPNYYSRFFGEGNWSNGSGVGNDFATERSMVRNLIVDSVMHWVEEYHIDGFRFDLAGLIDTQTVNEIVSTVHAKYPYVIFYGEGWAPGSTAVEEGYDLTTQGNAGKVPGFGFFNDTIRNAIAGDNGNSWGFATGSWDYADTIASAFRASNGWSTSPTQTINYVSCHDNYCLMDKIILSKNGTGWSDMVKMNDLSAAVYMLSQGTPFIYSGEELLREKKDSSGNRYDNAYGTDDYINKIRWSDLKSKEYAATANAYYAGLVDFRKNHAALRCPNGSDAWGNVSYHKISDQVLLFYLGGNVNGEVSDGIVIIFNASTNYQGVDLYKYGIPSGKWTACIHGDQAGTNALWTVDVTGNSGNVGVDAISTTVLVLGDLKDEDSVYTQNSGTCTHASHDKNGNCTSCGVSVGHSYGSWTTTTAATCTADGQQKRTCACGASETKTIAATGHSYGAWTESKAATCTADGQQTRTCAKCGSSETQTIAATGHSYGSWTESKAPTCTAEGQQKRTCSKCGSSETKSVAATGHSYGAWTEVKAATCTADGQQKRTCSKCSASETKAISALGHDYRNGKCTRCGKTQSTSVTAPAAPQILSCYSKLQTSVKVTWTTVDGADGYELWRSTTPNDPNSWTRAKSILSGTTDRYTNQGLTVGVTYYYKVRAFALDGQERVYSDFSAVDHMPAAVVFDGPYSNATFRIRLRWQEVGGCHGYQIWRQEPDGSWKIVKTLGDKGNTLTNDQGSTTAYSNTGLESGKTYTYKLRAFRITDDGRKVFGAYSDTYTVAVMPEAPALTAASPKAGRASLSWDQVDGAAGYQIWISESPDTGFSIAKSVTDGSTTYTKYGLENGKTYYFKIRAYVEVDGKKTFGAYSQTIAITIQ